MISKKELSYVSSWASKVPNPGEGYSLESFEKLEKALNTFDEKYNGVTYNICFSNKLEIELEILSKNLSHMLGINYKNIMGSYFSEFRRDVLGLDDTNVCSLSLLKSIVNNYKDVILYEKVNKINVINYYTVSVKCDIFKKIADLSKFNYGCIEFDKMKYNSISENNFNGNSEKLLYLKSGEINVPYFMMGILKKSDRNKCCDLINPTYAVETLFAPINPYDFFNGQEVSIPTNLLYEKNNEFIRKEANNNQKIKLLSIYKEIINEYKLENNLNIYGDYEAILFNNCGKNKTLKK